VFIPTTPRVHLGNPHPHPSPVHKFANLIVTFPCCSCPAGVNLLCVVGTTLSCSALWAARVIHTSVSIHYFLYSGRSDRRDLHLPDTVASDTSLGRGSCGPKKTILLPSPFLVLLFWPPLFFWGGVSISFLISWGLQLIDLLTYPGGPTTYGFLLITRPRITQSARL
jgi:hypothetical protein